GPVEELEARAAAAGDQVAVGGGGAADGHAVAAVHADAVGAVAQGGGAGGVGADAVAGDHVAGAGADRGEEPAQPERAAARLDPAQGHACEADVAGDEVVPDDIAPGEGHEDAAAGVAQRGGAAGVGADVVVPHRVVAGVETVGLEDQDALAVVAG